MKNLISQPTDNDLSLGELRGVPGSFQDSPVLFGSPEGVSSKLIQIISTAYTFLSIVGGITFIIYFVLGAMNWITAGEKQDQVQIA